MRLHKQFNTLAGSHLSPLPPLLLLPAFSPASTPHSLPSPLSYSSLYFYIILDKSVSGETETSNVLKRTSGVTGGGHGCVLCADRRYWPPALRSSAGRQGLPQAGLTGSDCSGWKQAPTADSKHTGLSGVSDETHGSSPHPP